MFSKHSISFDLTVHGTTAYDVTEKATKIIKILEEEYKVEVSLKSCNSHSSLRTRLTVDDSIPESKLEAIKTVRSLMNLSLKEAKDFIEGQSLDVPVWDADRIVSALRLMCVNVESKAI